MIFNIVLDAIQCSWQPDYRRVFNSDGPFRFSSLSLGACVIFFIFFEMNDTYDTITARATLTLNLNAENICKKISRSLPDDEKIFGSLATRAFCEYDCTLVIRVNIFF